MSNSEPRLSYKLLHADPDVINEENPQLTDKRLSNPEWLRGEYLQNNRSIADISDECYCSEKTVLRWLQKHEIAGHTGAEAQQ